METFVFILIVLLIAAFVFIAVNHLKQTGKNKPDGYTGGSPREPKKPEHDRKPEDCGGDSDSKRG